MKHIFIILLLSALVGACAKETLVQQGIIIQVTPDTLSAAERRHEILRASLEAALPYLDHVDTVGLSKCADVVAVAVHLGDIKKLLVLSESDTALRGLSDQVAASMAARSAALWPALRARWVELLPGELWLHGMCAHVDGHGHAVALVHTSFSAPDNIVDVQCLLQEELYALHFTQICYRPQEIPGAEMCFFINSKPDR